MNWWLCVFCCKCFYYNQQGILCPIGGIGVETPHLGHPNKSGTVLLGYWLGEEYWGQGIATDAVNIMLNYIFSEEFKIMVNQGSQVGRYTHHSQKWAIMKCV